MLVENGRPSHNRGMKLDIPTAWNEPLRQFTLYLRAAGRPETTIATRISHLARIARRISPEGPALITGEALVGWAGAQQWATETRRGYRNSARAFWRWALEAGVVEIDAAAAWPAVTPEAPRPRPAPERIYQAALAAAAPRERLMLRLAAELGMRRSEIARVHTRDLAEEFDGWVLTVHGKGNKIRVLPIPGDLARLVAAGPAGHSPGLGLGRTGFLFPGKFEGHLSPRYVGIRCARLLQDQQGPDERPLTVHKLRHRFASVAYRQTRNLRAVQEALGHRSLTTTQAYTAVDNAELRAAINSAA